MPTESIGLSAAILDTLSKNVSFSASIAAGNHVFMDALISGTPQMSLSFDALIFRGLTLGLDASILSPTLGDDLDYHRLEGEKKDSGEYGAKTLTEISYPRGLNPGE